MPKEAGSDGVLPEDLSPPVFGRCWGLGDDPEPTARVVNVALGLALGQAMSCCASRSSPGSRDVAAEISWAMISRACYRADG
jgi:hypothetical protein